MLCQRVWRRDALRRDAHHVRQRARRALRRNLAPLAGDAAGPFDPDPGPAYLLELRGLAILHALPGPGPRGERRLVRSAPRELRASAGGRPVRWLLGRPRLDVERGSIAPPDDGRRLRRSPVGSGSRWASLALSSVAAKYARPEELEDARRSVARGLDPDEAALVERLFDPGSRILDVGCGRSEEHTSELQSLAYLVCRLLLEKKKNQTLGTMIARGNSHH